MTLQKKLSSDFQARRQWYANRASAVFPVFMHDESSDVRIVFLNYFLLKNGIKNLVVNYRLYRRNGHLEGRYSEEVARMHNEFSVRDLITELPFEGMLDVEFVSTDNLRFAFPGIVGLYEANGLVSSVHSAGRVRNADEAYKQVVSPETNWTCKWEKGVTPFLHVFNGARARDDRLKVDIDVLSAENELLANETVETGIKASFSSEMVLLDEVFSRRFEKDSYVVAKVGAEDNFPRMVVGNYYREKDFMETTHSFARTEIEDYVEDPGDDRELSVMSLLQFEPLRVEGVVFPTNAEGSVQATLRRKSAKNQKLGEVESRFGFETGASGTLTKVEMNEDDEFCLLALSGDKVPARINCSFRYRVKGVETSYSTDIASGFKAWVFPDKYNHWGYGVVSEEFDTVIMIRNFAHRASDGGPRCGKLRIFDREGGCATVSVSIPWEGADKVAISEHVPGLRQSRRPESVSWYLEMDGPHAEVFWVSYAADGRILGDHAF